MSSFLHRSVATAPGKAILFGEHAVVYGTMAVAASLSDMRICADMVWCTSPSEVPSLFY